MKQNSEHFEPIVFEILPRNQSGQSANQVKNEIIRETWGQVVHRDGSKSFVNPCSFEETKAHFNYEQNIYCCFDID